MFLSVQKVSAQEKVTPVVADAGAQEENLPLMFKFEPEFLSTNKARKEEIAAARSIIDTLDISDKKRQKLLKELYKTRSLKRLQKTLMADTSFEEDQ